MIMEVAGLLIGAVPFMISALKQYAKARRGIRQFRRTSLYLAHLIQALREQKFYLKTDLEQLLRAAGFEEKISPALITAIHKHTLSILVSQQS